MTLEERFHEDMIGLFQRVGKSSGYWPRYYLRGVKNQGGLKYAKQKLSHPTDPEAGFFKLIEVGRPDLSVEQLVLSEEYQPLFTPAELKEARRRLSLVPKEAWRKTVRPDDNFFGEIENQSIYKEGTTKSVLVNQYERNTKARLECLNKYGYLCQVCGVDFEKTYGYIGEGFIHVHHKKPLAGIREQYKIDPEKDLIPVCPNCHAMLHTSNPPLSIDELRSHLISSKD